MTQKTDTVRARIEPELKEEVEKIFEQLGLNTSDAIRLFYRQVNLHKGLPFPIKVPNEETRKAIQEARERENLTAFDTPEDLFEDLGI